MLSVLIYQKSSQGFIDRYRALFEPFEESGEIAFCFWDTNGTDVSSALPELTGIVRGKAAWQAIVVMPVPDSGDAAEEPCRQNNPFDFLCNSEAEPPVCESAVPLIRLAQMLGGIPLVNQHYVNTVTDDGDEIRMRVLRQESAQSLREQQSLWNLLNDKYNFSCARPERLYLLKARQPMEIRLPVVKDTDHLNRHETDSSLFWYRNRYPARARFLVQDCARAGTARYHEDLFRFWMTALTLALNEFPSGTFEAYKVYLTRSLVDMDRVHKLLSGYYNRLAGVQYFGNLQIAELQKSSQFIRRQESLPMYEAEIPVRFELREDPALRISSSGIGYAGDCPIPEEPWWHEQVQESFRAARKMHTSTRIVLDRASNQCRYTAKVTEDEFYELDEYQFEEMEQQLADLEKEVLTFNTYMALPVQKYFRLMARAERETASAMKKRMERKTTILAGVAALVIYLLGFLPDLIYQMDQGDAFFSTLGLALLGCLVMLLAAAGCLIWFRIGIRSSIGSYNRLVNQLVGSFRTAGDRFSRYLSKCSSLMRGRFILQALKRRTLISSEEIVQIGHHVEQLGVQLGIIAGWLNDFDLKALPDKGSHNKEYFDFDIPPEKNRGYSIRMDCEPGPIPSVGGSRCTAPYPFITEFEVQREALFEKESELYSEEKEAVQ